MFPFLNFHDNFICLIWITLDNIQSRNKNKWSPFWPLCPYHVGNFARLLFPLFCLYVVSTNQGHHPFQWSWQGIKGAQTGDQEIKIVNFAMTIIFWGDINCFARHKPIIWYYKRSIPAQKYTLPGINSYWKILGLVSLIYLFISNHLELNTMTWI